MACPGRALNRFLPFLFPVLWAGIANPAPLPAGGPDTDEADLHRYEVVIRELEQTGGAYNYPMGEELVGLGLALRRSGKLEQALEAFNRALTIIRANQGLESPGQMAVLDMIIDTNQARGDWEMLDDNYQYLHWLTKRIYRNADPGRFWETSVRLARWHLQAYRSYSDPIPFKHLLSLDELFHSAFSVMEQHYGPDDPRLVEALNGIVLAGYHIASYIMGIDANSFEEVRTSSMQMDRPETITEPYLARQMYLMSSQNKRNDALHRIIRILARNSGLPVADRARALVNLADWYLLSGWDSKAFATYRHAIALLDEAHADASIREELFGTAVRLPAIRSSAWCLDRAQRLPYVDLEFDVRRDGTVRSIRITATSELDNPVVNRKRARTYLRNSRFRPLIEEGVAVNRRTAVIRLSGTLLETGEDRDYPAYPCATSGSGGQGAQDNAAL